MSPRIALHLLLDFQSEKKKREAQRGRELTERERLMAAGGSRGGGGGGGGTTNGTLKRLLDTDDLELEEEEVLKRERGGNERVGEESVSREEEMDLMRRQLDAAKQRIMELEVSLQEKTDSESDGNKALSSGMGAATTGAKAAGKTKREGGEGVEEEENDDGVEAMDEDGQVATAAGGGGGGGDVHQEDGESAHVTQEYLASFAARARSIPLRLTLKERKRLRLLEAALSVSEYTDKVDVLSYSSKTTRIHQQLREICAILSGLLVASDYKAGQQLIVEKNFSDNRSFFQAIFEIGRRHKIMNPEKMRTEYGKLIYLLQDSVDPTVQELLEFKCVSPLVTVHSTLSNGDAGDMMKDPLVAVATAEISAQGKSRMQIQRDIKKKEQAQEILAKKYSNAKISADSIRSCLYSISDNSSFLAFNRDPVDRMIRNLKAYFDPNQPESRELSLAINMGDQGARLSHSHQRQYTYVLQSLTLWHDILDNFYRLWVLAEEDLLDERNTYRLRDTGQGLNRVQSASRVSRAMQGILHRCQQRCGSWVGSSVVHLGDSNVPNALIFIDKYTQVSRILNPIDIVLRQLRSLCSSANPEKRYIDATFGGVDNLTKMVLADFFRHAFDGSGADNFFDAGSCIDGRLTSAWNWCSKIEKKSYYPAFLLAGFVGFDGEFK